MKHPVPAPAVRRLSRSADLGGLARGDPQQLGVVGGEDPVGVAGTAPHLGELRQFDVHEGPQGLRVPDRCDTADGLVGPCAHLCRRRGPQPVHAEQGEESFMVERDADGQVTFEIIAVSKPKHPLARLAPPITRFMQRRATEG